MNHEQPDHGHAHRSHHEHLWHLADGTGLHAPPGELIRDTETGMVCCHLCGEYFRSLGAHVRTHGHSAHSYRGLLGLAKRAPLTSPEVSAVISERQRVAYQEPSSALRDQLAAGIELARSGELTRRSLTAEGAPRPQSQANRRRALDAGRLRQQTQRAEAAHARTKAAGFSDLAASLHELHAGGCTLAEAARETGLGRRSLRAEMHAAGLAALAPGQNTVGGKRSRAAAADIAAACVAGTDNLAAWLVDQRSQGRSVLAISRQLGRSNHWVAARLRQIEREQASAVPTEGAA